MRLKKTKCLKLPYKVGIGRGSASESVIALSDSYKGIYAFATHDIQPLWVIPAKGFHVSCALPTRVVVHSDRFSLVRGLVAETGETVWAAESWAGDCSPWRDRLVVSSARGSTLHILSPETGECERMVPLPGPRWWIGDAHAFAKREESDAVACVELESGRVLWEADLPRADGPHAIPLPLGVYSGVFVAQRDRTLRAWHVPSGAVAWELVFPGSVSPAAAAPAGLVVGSSQELIGVDPVSGEVRWNRSKAEYGAPECLYSILYRGFLVLRGSDDTLCLISPADGSIRTTYGKVRAVFWVEPWPRGLILLLQYGRVHLLEEMGE